MQWREQDTRLLVVVLSLTGVIVARTALNWIESFLVYAIVAVLQILHIFYPQLRSSLASSSEIPSFDVNRCLVVPETGLLIGLFMSTTDLSSGVSFITVSAVAWIVFRLLFDVTSSISKTNSPKDKLLPV